MQDHMKNSTEEKLQQLFKANSHIIINHQFPVIITSTPTLRWL